MKPHLPVLISVKQESLYRKLQQLFLSRGSDVFRVSDPGRIEEMIRRSPFELVILEAPEGLRQIHTIRSFSQIPVILSLPEQKGGLEEMAISALESGADDYFDQTTSPKLLEMKFNALLRRAYDYQISSKIELGPGLLFDLASGTLTWKDQPIPLTRTEQSIVTCLAAHRGEIVTRKELMMLLWKTCQFINDGTLSTCVSRLRAKLRLVCGMEMIQTRRGKGYFIP